jgi:hypothetical protein
VALSAATAHLFKGPFNTAVLAEDHQKHRGDKEVHETHLAADVAAMQHLSNTYTGRHAKHSSKRKTEAKVKHATSTTTGSSAHTSAASSGTAKRTSDFEPFSGLNNMRSASTSDTVHWQQRGHSVPQKATPAAANTAHQSSHGAVYERHSADRVQQHGLGPAAHADQRVKEEPHWGQFGELQEVDPKLSHQEQQQRQQQQQQQGRSILKNGSSNIKSEPDVFQQAAVPISATFPLNNAAAPFAPELQAPKQMCARTVKREIVIVHTDDTTELARTEVDLLDDTQDALPAFCKLCGNDFKTNLRLIAGRPFAH